MQIFTIGYEGATVADFVQRLVDAGVTQLADVRAVPLSRRPGFSKNVLAAALKEAGIAYLGFKALGTPPAGREAARKGKRDLLAEIYAGQLDLPEAGLAIAQLRDAAAEQPTVLLCFERDPTCCHRTLLADAAFADATITELFV